MNQQIVLNFDATGFEGFEDVMDCFGYVTRTLKNQQGGKIQQKYQAADMGMSPAQWSQKVNGTNNTTVTLSEAIEFMLNFHDRRWLDYAEWLWLENNSDDLEELEKMQEQIQSRIDAAKNRKPKMKVA